MVKTLSSRPTLVALSALMLAASLAAPAYAQTGSVQADTQMASVLRDKDFRTAAQSKIGSQLWHAVQASRGSTDGTLTDMYGSAIDAAKTDVNGNVRVTVRGTVDADLAAYIASLGGQVLYTAKNKQSALVSVPLASVEALASKQSVARVGLAAPARTNVGALTSQGYISHKANQVVASGIDGTGVRVGVLSDSVEALSALIATGDLPTDTVIVPGQAGAGESEGTAMMEIVHDIAPGAKLFFASAFNGEESFADNIRTLRNVYHCDIIVDDVSYFDEPAFQDGIVAQAVNDVTADGALYFSSAANSGNLTSGTSGTWEGDFTPGAASGGVLPAGYTLHQFKPGQNYNVLTASTVWVGLHWADGWGASGNDYDLWLLNSTGTAILCASTDVQAGADFPLEACYKSSGWPAGSRIVIGKKAGAEDRAMHIDTERGTLSVATAGATFGHNAGAKTVSTAAVYWNSAKTGTRPFVGGAANPTETFSSDGPRKIFYQPDGTPITPGNFLFTSAGGQTLVKPDIAAADGASSKTPGFNPFFGTSAAAPHAAGIAALIKQARPDYTNAQILNAMKQTALDIRAVGLDRDSGYGIVMAREAVTYAQTH
jgi:hypothetical protein